MKKNKKPRNGKLPGFAEDFKPLLMRRAVTSLVIVLFVLAVFCLVKAFLYRSDYFRLRTVETRSAFLDQRSAAIINNQILIAYKGRNLFRIDLKNVAQSIQGSYADIKDVVASIALPDKLVISLKLRRPVAFVRSVKFYPIDEEGVVLPGTKGMETFRDLPVIEGVDIRYSGKRGIPRNLILALSLLRDIKSAKFMSSYGVTAINAQDPKNMSFYMKNGVEVRIGAENFRDRLVMLGHTLRDPRLVMDKIKYIDVRFKEEVAIGPR